VRLLALMFSSLALAVAVYGAIDSEADAPPARARERSLAAARFFVLLPDGRVEITDAWSRRIFRWDGRRWVQVESRALPRPESS
jgi:hypothetical protein